jgi:hypothetical protein
MEHLKDGVIGYSNIRALFRPDQLIVQKLNGEYQILKCTGIDDDGRDVEIEARRVEYDGSKFGVITEKLYIGKYAGLKKITDLIVYPLLLDSKVDEIRGDVLDRGRKYATLQAISHHEYKGPVISAGQKTVRATIFHNH